MHDLKAEVGAPEVIRASLVIISVGYLGLISLLVLKDENPSLEGFLILVMIGFHNYFFFPYMHILPCPFQVCLIIIHSLAPLLTATEWY